MVDKEEAGDWLRCVDCKRLASKKQTLVVGCCSACGCNRVRNSNPTKWEKLLIIMGVIK